MTSGRQSSRISESNNQVEKSLAHSKNIGDIKFLLNMKNVHGKNRKSPKFPQSKEAFNRGLIRLVHVANIGHDRGGQRFHLNNPTLAYFDKKNVKRLQQYYAGRLPLFVHTCLYKVTNLTFPLGISELSPNSILKSGMSLGSSSPRPCSM